MNSKADQTESVADTKSDEPTETEVRYGPDTVSSGNTNDSRGAGNADVLTQHSTPSPVGAPDLIPMRMLKREPAWRRLGYLEFVHGEWDDNLETKQGTFGHRRVDKQDRKNVQRPVSSDQSKDTCDASDQRERVGDSNSPNSSDSPTPSPAGAPDIHARSIMLSAPGEGLIAKLDLLELTGVMATPVDYKRGDAPKIPEGAYEPERVQMCAQALILRENGFQCDEGVLYFIASKETRHHCDGR